MYQYGRHVARLLRAYPDKPANEYSPEDIKAVLRTCPERSRYMVRSVYRNWFRWLHERERVDRDPMIHVRKMKEPKRLPADVFTETEIALLENLPVPDGPLWAFLFGTGARRGDARTIRREHIDLERRRVVFLDGKGGKDAVVPITHHLAAAIADLDLHERLERHDHLWYRNRYRVTNPKRRGPYPIGDSTFDQWYKRTLKLAGVRYLSPHKTRHTYGRWLQRSGRFDLEERSILMRHENVQTTKKYYPTVNVDSLAEKFALL